VKWRLEAASPTRLLRFGLFEAANIALAVEEQVYGLVRQNEPPVARSDAQVALPAPPGG